MNTFEKVLVILFIVIGLSCLTLSAVWLAQPYSLMHYVHMFIHLVIIIAIPILILWIIVLFINKYRT